MGLAMATNLQRHLKGHGGPSLSYNNRTMSRGQSLQALGAIPCENVQDLVLSADIVFISVGRHGLLAIELRDTHESMLSFH